jgi:hypothetical protein
MKRIAVLSTTLALLVGLNFAYAGDDVVELKDRKSDTPGLKSKVPAGWKAQKPSNNLRLFQFAVPKADGDSDDAELVVFSFGASDKAENIKRWKTQFIAPKGKTIDDVSKVEEYKLGKVAEVVCLDIWGTYKYKFPPNDPRAKETLKENYRRFNVMIETQKDTFFITLTGPAKTMAKHKEAFDGFIKAFK